MATIDIKIQNRCDHRIPGERVALAIDGLTLSPQFPIASEGSLRLVRNDVDMEKGTYAVKERKLLTGETGFKDLILAVREQSYAPYFEASYNTFGSNCPKCAGALYTDDFTDDGMGGIETVGTTGILVQSVEKVVVTELHSNKYAAWVGTGLHNLIGSKISDFSVLSSEIKNDVRTALLSLQRYQIQHMQANDLVDPSEVLGQIISIDATQNAADPTVVELFVRYTSRSGQAYDYSQYLELANFRYRG